MTNTSNNQSTLYTNDNTKQGFSNSIVIRTADGREVTMPIQPFTQELASQAQACLIAQIAID